MKTRMVFGIFVLALLAVLTPTSARLVFAQTSEPVESGNGRWTPYLGCWRLLAENVRNQSIADLIRSATPNTTTPAVTVCVQPATSGGATTGVTMTTFADGKRVLQQAIAADGAGHPVSESGCVGTQTSDWSRDGLRLFTRVEMACNDRPKQTVSGLTMFARGPAWVDIQAMTTDGDQQVRIRRYVRTLDQPEGLTALPAAVTGRAIVDAQNAATRKLSLEDVTEATAKVSSQAVEAAIVETESRFTLNSRVLLQLADAGVSPNVIDLMVAQSFPAHFRVERPMTMSLPPVAASTPSMIPGVPGAQYSTPYPFYPYGGYGAYDPYAYYSLYYSPFAYPYYWGSGYYRAPVYYINNGSVITGGSGGSQGGATGASGDRGQVVNGRGYTRVHTGSEPDATGADPNQHTTTSTPRTVRSSTPSTGADSSSSSPSSSGSSGTSSSGGSGGVSSSGGYSGGGGGDSGRTAQPR